MVGKHFWFPCVLLAVTSSALSGTTTVAQGDNTIKTNADPSNTIVLVPGKKVILQCNATEYPNTELTWLKDDQPLNRTDRIIIHSNNNSVLIRKSTMDDTGNYMCVLPISSTYEQINATIYIRTKAMVVDLPRSMNLVQGDRLVLHCNATGNPLPEIKWYKGNDLINASDSRIKLIKDEAGMEGAKLIIEELDFDDRDYYTCEAENENGSTNTTILVRVKDKLAALWPFLGICAEVAVLCTIIFIYEKKRVKPDFDESDNDQNPESKSVPDQREKGQEVRQRK